MYIVVGIVLILQLIFLFSFTLPKLKNLKLKSPNSDRDFIKAKFRMSTYQNESTKNLEKKYLKFFHKLVERGIITQKVIEDSWETRDGSRTIELIVIAKQNKEDGK